MFWKVLSFELRDHLRRVSTYVFFAALFLLALVGIVSDATAGSGRVFLNSPYSVAKQMVILAAIGQVVTAAVVGLDAVRDFRWRTDELLFTTPLTKAQYLGGRFAGVCLVMLALYCAIPLGSAANMFMPWADSAKLLPFAAGNYINPFLVVVLPGVLAMTTLFFAIGLITRNEMAIYTQGVVLLAVASMAGALLASVDQGRLGALIDPFGIDTINHVTRYWTIDEKNSRLFALSGALLGSRMIWLTIAAFALAIGWTRFRLQVRQSAGGRSRPRNRSQPAPEVSLSRTALLAMTPRFDRRTWINQLAGLTWFSFIRIIQDKAFLALAAAGLLNALINAWYAGIWYGTPIYPVTGTVATAIITGSQFYFVILAVIYAGELAWRERQLGASGVVDALPVPTAVTMTGKLFGLLTAEAGLLLVLLAGGIAVQVFNGHFDFDFPLYLRFLFGIQFPAVVAFTLLAFFVHSVANNKYLGHFLLVVIYVLTQSLSSLGFEHQLWKFAAWPDFAYSDINGFGRYAADIAWLSLVWLFAGMLLSVVACLFWARGSDERWGVRLRRARVRFGVTAASVAGLSAMATLGCAGIVFYNTNILNTYQSSAAGKQAAATYERTYRQYAGVAQPWLTSVKVRADLFPDRNAMSLSGVQTYVNKEGKPLDTLFLSLDPTVRVDAIKWSRAVTPVSNDMAMGVQIFRLSAPLAPGASINLSYRVRYQAQGFANANPNHAVVANGTYLNPDTFAFTPVLGYQPFKELSDEADRARYGLAPKPRMHPIDDENARDFLSDNQYVSWIDLDSVVSTAPGQIAIAPGDLVRQWTENGRPVFHYHANAPMLPAISFASGRYATRNQTWRAPDGNQIPIDIFYDPKHEANVQRILDGAQRSLAYSVKNFGPYQFRQLRIVEVPEYVHVSGLSGPGMIAFSEWPVFLLRVDNTAGSLDMPSWVATHEVAHQWWTHQVIGADVQGRSMITESLAEYTALMVMEHTYGRAQVHRFLRYELDRYLAGRGNEGMREMPLALVEDGQNYIAYNKGALAFYALRDYLGEDKINSVLRGFLARHRFSGPPFPTSGDLIAELRAAAPAKLQPVITDLFDTITLWNLRAEDATVTRRADGRYNVQLRLAASKARADALGHETPIPIDDEVDVGVFAEGSAGDPLSAPLVVRKYHLTQPITTVTLTVDRKPLLAGLDPYNKLIDRAPDDNIISVTAAR